MSSYDAQMWLDDLMRAGLLTYEQSERVIAAWVKFLERLEPDTFSTITFDANKSGVARSGQNAVDRAVKVVEQVSRDIQHPIPSFIVSESHRLGGVYHCHGLHRLSCLAGFDGLARSMLWRTAFARYGRCEFRAIESVGGVKGYVSKYVVKSRADWSILYPSYWKKI